MRVLRLISSGTVEELVLARAQRKLEIDGKVIQAGKFDDVTSDGEYEALLAKAFEAQGEDDNEETNELDDDELNELLARGDHELEKFAEMDREREANKAAQWKAEGHKGPLPPPLMQESELPPFYRRDIGEELAAQVQLEEEAGRGRRARDSVRYTDGLTDDQWLNAMENSDDDVEEAAERKRGRANKRQERKRMNDMLAQAEAEGKPLNATSLNESSTAVSTPQAGSSKKKRARPSKSQTPSMMGDEVPSVSLAARIARRADQDQQKKRKTEDGPAPGPTPAEVALMNRLYDATNALKSAEDEPLNVYFMKPVDKKVDSNSGCKGAWLTYAQTFFDYYEIIKRPMTMNQIKRRIGKDSSFTLPAFRADMHQVWDNARTYNQEGSWVYNAAEEMQRAFDKMWEEEMSRLQGLSDGAGGGESGLGTAAGSGTSTPMFKPQDQVKVPTATKIKLKLGQSSRSRAIEPSPSVEGDGQESESDASDSDDDDY